MRTGLTRDRPGANGWAGTARGTIGWLKSSINSFFSRHEFAWELVMGALAIAYVGIGVGLDGSLLAPALTGVEQLITAIFATEFGIRLWAAPQRRRYILGHVTDLLALLPAARPLRALRLLRLVRLVRSIPLLYATLGLDLAVVRRVGWHFDRIGSHLERRLVILVGGVITGLIATAAVLVTVLEKQLTVESFGDSLYWGINTVLGSGDPGYVASPLGWALSWSMILLSLTLIAVATGAIVTFVIDVALKEGRGMGAAGYQGHIVICGWNTSAREVIEELQGDEYGTRLVLLWNGDANPAGNGVYFISGDPANHEDLARAGIAEASAALIFPSSKSDEDDMRSILVVLAIESMAPAVRTVVEVNNPRHVEHFRRARADEVVVPSQIAAHLAARTALYPGLTELVSDIVSGGEGSELYRVRLPPDYYGDTVDVLAARLMREHRATLIAISRNGRSIVNPPSDFLIGAEDDALVVAESIATLNPFQVERASGAQSRAAKHPA